MSAPQMPQTELRLPDAGRLSWRVGGLADSAAVARLAESAFDPHYREAWTEAQIAALLATSGAWLDLGLAPSRGAAGLMAFAMSRQIFDDAELLLCAVAPGRRGTGEGRRMMETVAASARARGARRLFLEVRASNEPALSLYRSAGFAPEGRRPGYYRTLAGESIDAITFARAL